MKQPKLALHIGAHGKVSQALNKILSANQESFHTQNIAVPRTRKFMDAFREYQRKFDTGLVVATDRDLFFERLAPNPDLERIVATYDGFISDKRGAITQHRLYPGLDNRLGILADLVGKGGLEIYFGIEPLLRFPVTIYDNISKSTLELLRDGDYLKLRWIELITRLSNAVPHAQITVFCAEDAPSIWPKLISEITGGADPFDLNGLLDFPSKSIFLGDRDGYHEMLAAVRKEVEAFAAVTDHFVQQVESKLTFEMYERVVGWTPEEFLHLSEAYEKDLEEIPQLPNVALL